MDEDRLHFIDPVAEVLFAYLRDVIYHPADASLQIEQLPEEFRDFGRGLQFFSNSVIETMELAKELAAGNLNCKPPRPGNEIAAPLKSLHASLKHLTWQSQQVAKGDYKQHVDFMGDFSEAFNNMIKQLEERRKISLDEKSRLERYVDLMLSNSPDPILLFDRRGRLAYASDSYLKRFEISDPDAILRKRPDELFAHIVTGEALQNIEKLFEVAVSEKDTVQMEQDLDFGQNGSSRHYQIQVTSMLDANGNTGGIMAVMHDTTEITRARLEAEQARELAEQSSRAKSDFLSRMSHEMRTPMNAVIGMAAIYNASEDQKRKDYCVEKIDEASRHLLDVINDILDMSKIEADKFEISSSKFDFERMIGWVTGVMMFRVEERGQHMSIDIDPELPKIVVADEQRLAQVITNLLSNAVKFTPDGGNISLSAKKVSEENGTCVIRLAVSDNGIGISAEHQKRLFMPFEQADGSISRKFGGTGLGLAICKRIIEMMGGEIRIESEIGKGATFVFEIPVKIDGDQDADINTGGKNNDSEEDSEDGIFFGRRILLAEDVEINREVLTALLEHTAIQIDSAEDGIDAIEKFSAHPDLYDLILMDIHMPNMDGYEATRQIRTSGLTGADTIPIVAMTANVFREDIERCLACGMDSHLGKPIDADEVIRRLKKYLL